MLAVFSNLVVGCLPEEPKAICVDNDDLQAGTCSPCEQHSDCGPHFTCAFEGGICADPLLGAVLLGPGGPDDAHAVPIDARVPVVIYGLDDDADGFPSALAGSYRFSGLSADQSVFVTYAFASISADGEPVPADEPFVAPRPGSECAEAMDVSVNGTLTLAGGSPPNGCNVETRADPDGTLVLRIEDGEDNIGVILSLIRISTF